MVEASIVNQPVNQSVIFTRECDLILTSDSWTVVIQLDLNPYEEAITILHKEVGEIQNVTTQSMHFDEVQRIQTVLDSLEKKLFNVKQFLPKPDRKRGLINFGGSVLKFLFGAATVSDLGELHSTIDTLSSNQQVISHAVNKQVTLLKQLDSAVRINQDTITNLTCIVKEYVLNVQDKFANTVSKLEWMTKQREVDAALRNLEFAVTQLELQLDELFRAFETLHLGNFPLNLINFDQLHVILTNVTLTLPAGFALPFGSHKPNVPMYYPHLSSAMLVDHHRFMLAITLPLVADNRKFEVLRIHSFPVQIANGTYVRLKLYNGFLAVNEIHHTFFTLDAVELSKCRGNNIKLCSADKPVRYSNGDPMPCELQLFLHKNIVNTSCERLVAVGPFFPEIHRQGTAIVYYVPNPTRASFRCWDGTEWNTSSFILQDAGILMDVLACHVTAGSLLMYARLSGETVMRARDPVLIIPPHQEVVTHTELEQLRDATVGKATYELLNTLSQHKAEPSMADWLNFHSVVSTSTNCPCWTTNIYISLSISVTTLIIYHGMCTVWSKFLNRCTLCKPVKAQDHKESRAPTPIPQPRIGQATSQGPSPPGPSKDEAPLSHAVYAVHDNALQ